MIQRALKKKIVIYLFLLVFILLFLLLQKNKIFVNHNSKTVDKNVVTVNYLQQQLPPKNIIKEKNHLIFEVTEPDIYINSLNHYLNQNNVQFSERKFSKVYLYKIFLKKQYSILVRKFYEKPEIAVLIDDVGYKFSLLKELNGFHLPLSFAIFPFEVFSKKSAYVLHNYGFETLLHLPMEPIKYKEDHSINGMLLTNMSKNEMKKIIDSAQSNLIGIVGVNNHVGSKFTSDPEAMEKFSEVLKNKGLFFIDSYTISTSVAEQTVFKNGIPTVKRDIFLDNSLKINEMNIMWQKALKFAERNGKVLIIGHFYPNTIKFIKKKLPLAIKQGFVPVYVSEILK